jgi:antitoxin (DNA-binding transcriptional repressor) of toxin-antitoxin stability system
MRGMCHNGHMPRHVTIRELHEKTGAFVDDAAAGEVIVIRRRGVPIAELRRLSPKPQVAVPNFTKRYARYPQVRSDSGRILEEDRR